MLSKSIGWGLAAIAIAAFGCGKSNENDTGKTGPAPMSLNASNPQPPTARDAKLVVLDFLRAVQKGDDATAKSLLTKLAAQKVGTAGYSVDQAFSSSAKIEVDEATYPTPEHDIAHVPTRLIDVDESGHQYTDQSTWICRREPEGWRVAGLAAYIFENEEPLLLSFENPEDLAKKQQWLKEELQRRAKQANPAKSGISTAPPQTSSKPQDAFRR